MESVLSFLGDNFWKVTITVIIILIVKYHCKFTWLFIIIIAKFLDAFWGRNPASKKTLAEANNEVPIRFTVIIPHL